MRVAFCDIEAVNAPYAAALAKAHDRVMKRAQFILGAEVRAFESEWATYCGTKHAVGVGNGFDALRLMLAAAGIGPGHEVIVPSNTYIATWLAVMAVGARPVPVEPDVSTWNIDPERIGAAVTKDTRAILAVHLYGRAAPMAELAGIARTYGLRLFVDAAQAHGIRDLGDAAAFSFYPTKNLGALGDAGAVVTDDDGLADRVRLLRNYGSVEKNVHEVAGCNSRMDELQAAYLLAKLPWLDRTNGQRRAIARRYDDVARASVERPAPCDDVSHLYVVMTPHRDALAAELAKRGIETAMHYPTPPHRQKACEGIASDPLPLADRFAAECLSLPCWPGMPDCSPALAGAIRAVA